MRKTGFKGILYLSLFLILLGNSPMHSYGVKLDRHLSSLNAPSRFVNADLFYVYDEAGRLLAVIDPSGDTAIYRYDAVGNILSISRQSSSLVSLIEFTPNEGSIGASVTIYGTGFSATPSQNTVTFNGVTATVTSSAANQIVTSVPAGATSGTITVTTPSGSATSSELFTVTASSSGVPSITSFSPAIANLGTSVTITGTNFDSAPLNNNISFHKTHSLVDSSTSTSITTSVPPGATSGRISVSTPYGSATSSADFFVPPPSFTASDVQYTGRMATGETETVSIGTANRIGLVVFDGTIGQRISLNMTGATISNSTIYIYNPDGSVLYFTTSVGTTGRFIDTQLLSQNGTYTILIDPQSTNTGNMTLNLYNVVHVTGTITPAGASVSASITTPGQNVYLTFSGTAGQQISLNITGVTIATGSASIIKPDGTALVAPVTVNTSGKFIDTVSLPVSGTYTIILDPTNANTGNATVSLYNAPDVSDTITPGGSSVAITTTVPGQNARLTFSGSSGQIVSLRINSATMSNTDVSILKPDGTTLAGFANVGTGGAFIDAQTLTTTGTYTVLIDLSGTNTGSMTLTMYDITDVTGSITPGGTPVTITISTPGQNARLTFTGTAGQRVSLNITGVTITSSNVSINKPDGTVLVASTFVNTSGKFIDAVGLPTTGTYTIISNPASTNTGSQTLTLYDVPADVSDTIVAGGSAVTVTTTVAGQNARLTFTGTSGQRISLRMQSVTITSSDVTIYKPDGSTLAGFANVSTGGAFIDVQSLPTTGTYEIVVDPANANTGSMTLTLYDVPADVSTTTSIGSPAITVTISAPGQNASITFSGTAAQQVTVRVTTNTVGGSTTVRLLKPDGSQLGTVTSSAASFNMSMVTLPTTGTYTISINPSSFNTGSLDVRVTNP